MLHPQAKSVLDELQRRSAAQPEPADAAERLWQARTMTAGLADFSGDAPAMAATRTIEAPGPRGPIVLRLYRPTATPVLPVLVWFHGGGAMAGSLDTHDTPLRQLAAATGWAIASVGYRIGPEHPYPASHEDCLAAAGFVEKQADALGLDAARLAVGGDSIGGLFAATVARLAMTAHAPRVAAVVMLYPNTDLRPDRPHRSLVSEEGHVMTRASMAYENDLYIPEIADRYSPIASPLLADDLGGLPPALLVTCGHDPLRDEGEAFGEKLEAAGVAVSRTRIDGTIHAVLQMKGRLDAAGEIRTVVKAFLARVHD